MNTEAVMYTDNAIREYLRAGATFEEAVEAIPRIHAAYMAILTGGSAAPKPKQEPAVPIKNSVTEDYIICLEDGKKFKSMKSHLRVLGMTPEEYRAKWGLPSDYPMVCASYSAKRSQLAKDSGLGRK